MPASRPRTALVTGSARRVGRAIAEALVADGWLVLVHARDAARAREAADEMGAASSVGADLAQVEQIDHVVAAVDALVGEEGGALDLLVNSASSFERVDDWTAAGADGWARAMDVNARAPYLLTCALVPRLRLAGGLVVNVSDRAAIEHWESFPIHAASKAALDSLTISGARALVDDGVRVMGIAPGLILPPEDWSDERIAREQATGNVGTPDELCRLIVELAADPSRTGEVVVL